MDRNIDLDGSNMNLSDEAKNVLRSMPVEILDIPNRAKNALVSAGVKNALNAIEAVKTEFDGISGIGSKTITESISKIDDLLEIISNVEPDLILNILDPRESYFEHANGNILQVFSPIIDLYFEKNGGIHATRNKDILCKRFNLAGAGEYTLEDIGTYYDLTRERVRQVEAKTISDLDLLLSGELKTKNWRLDSRLVGRYLVLKEKLRGNDFILSTIELNSILNEKFGTSLELGEFRVFMEILGYIELPSHIDGYRGKIKSCWCLSDRFDRKEIESIFQSLDVVFDFVDPIKKFDLIIKAKRKAKKRITNESIHIALKSCEEIEEDDDLISIKFNYLRSAADKAYRLLSAKNKPLHYSELCKEINLLEQSLTKSPRPMNQTNLKNQMVADERFKPIGRSGEWGLSKWSNYKNVTIIQAIESVLHKSGSPLSFSDIAKGVKEIRPDASKRSFLVYLMSEPTKFTKVGDDLYALASWKMDPFKRRKVEKVSNEVFYDVAKSILEQQNPIPFPKFIEKMSNKTDLKEPSIRVRVNESPILKTRDTSKRYKEVYCDDLNFNLEDAGLVRTLLRDRVQNEIRSILYEKPNIPMKKGDLYKSVNKAVPCQRPTFYRYLEETTDVKKYKEGNDYYAVYEHSESVSKIDINLAEYNLDSTLMAKLLRPASMLDLENIDIALFELGLIFENELKEYLTEARASSTIKVFQKDMRKLSTMIDCVVREGVVTKGHHLNTLREERNNRAHGKQPSIEERTVLFNKAHYLAELFIRYIATFNKLKRDIIEI
jgi:DNA-directed RNA polymerase delta subunit